MLVTIIYTLLSLNNILSPTNNILPPTNNILPPINNIYYSNQNIPFVGKQSIIYQRKKNLVGEVKLSGNVNVNGYIYYNPYNLSEYVLDDALKKIMKKYRCSLYRPYYDNDKDIIILNIQINPIRYSKKLTLINNQC